ncbi:lactoylglutathione lyase-like [Lycorma delicatula]|uniref:lactoylglutathione lyase-like n=1 Tax=Lycorma delicatula TaxID=130591 RepID=UPI003F518500
MLRYVVVLGTCLFAFVIFNYSSMGETVGLSDSELKELCEQPDASTKDFIMQQTNLCIKDPRKSLPFYTRVLGMTLLQKFDFPEMKLTAFFLGYENPDDIPKNKADHIEWTFTRKATIELVHQWGTENDPNFKCKGSSTEGFGHFGLHVPDIEKACERFESLGVEFVKKINDAPIKRLAFIKDPDGYKIEIINGKALVPFLHQRK